MQLYRQLKPFKKTNHAYLSRLINHVKIGVQSINLLTGNKKSHPSRQTNGTNKTRYILPALIAVMAQTGFAGIKLKPTPLTELQYNKPLLSGEYNPQIPTPDAILGFPVGQRTATPEQIVNIVKTISNSSDRIQLIEYARSHEGRPLYYAIISTAQNLKNIEQTKQNLSKLANPKDLSTAQQKEIIQALPAVSWMAYSIHGNESSGSDSALAAIYHLAAATDSETLSLLEKSIIIIDPSMNPDGRARFTKALQQNRGVSPNIDDQSLLHAGVWPYGRTNHYLFDLNRDFILGVHPETVGRVKAINEWHPQLVIDAHEMGAQSSYLFAPAREPVNKNLSPATKKWGLAFAEDQAAAFDKNHWPYFTGEWFENLYPGYSSYSEFRGSVHILYEQARMAEDGVMQSNGRVLTYQESVHHQLVSTIENLKTLAKHSKAMYEDFVNDKRQLISANSPFANITFALPPTKNTKRWLGFIRLMELQGFEIHTTTKAMSFNQVTTQLGETTNVTLPKGSLIIRARQSQARLITAILEFDAKIDNEVLIEERQKILRDGSSLMYDTTAWNLTMMHGLTAYTIPEYVSNNLAVYQSPEPAPAIVKKKDYIAYVVDGANDASVGFAAQLLEQGIKVRVIDKAAELDGQQFSRGSVVVSRYDNQYQNQDLTSVVESTAQNLKVSAIAINDGLGDGDLPDIGGSHFRMLSRPQIAILTNAGINTYDYGSIWFSIDNNLGIRHSHLDAVTFSYNDLRRYNTLILPDRYYGSLSKPQLDALKNWVSNGGTLIAVDGSIQDLINPEAQFSQVRPIDESFKNIQQYDLALQQEWLAQQPVENFEQIWSHKVLEELNSPLQQGQYKNEKELKSIDQWQRQFMPSGAMVAARVDQKHWLTFGTPETIPLLFANHPILMSARGSQAPVRLGSFSKMDKSVWQKLTSSLKDNKKIRRVGWSSLPDEYELKLRMSGLLWPEAAQRIANAAYLSRERLGNGQIILFAGQPNFRGSTLASNRLLLNAIVYGTGLGANTPIAL
ncbi:M14 family metallopeptidase [Aliikangiella maris]|uniref:M14 family metallopeptidase n=2 Tax=Aliikangiella maris TaxID=3162458 RepID=A0ABV3MIS7_9GAMM